MVSAWSTKLHSGQIQFLEGSFDKETHFRWKTRGQVSHLTTDPSLWHVQQKDSPPGSSLLSCKQKEKKINKNFAFNMGKGMMIKDGSCTIM